MHVHNRMAIVLAAAALLSVNDVSAEPGSVGKWCGPNGAVRFSNADLSAEGLKPCGSLSVVPQDQPGGGKLFGPPGEIPKRAPDLQHPAAEPRALRSDAGSDAGSSDDALPDSAAARPQKQFDIGDALADAGSRSGARRLAEWVMRVFRTAAAAIGG